MGRVNKDILTQLTHPIETLILECLYYQKKEYFSTKHIQESVTARLADPPSSLESVFFYFLRKVKKRGFVVKERKGYAITTTGVDALIPFLHVRTFEQESWKRRVPRKTLRTRVVNLLVKVPLSEITMRSVLEEPHTVDQDFARTEIADYRETLDLLRKQIRATRETTGLKRGAKKKLAELKHQEREYKQKLKEALAKLVGKSFLEELQTVLYEHYPFLDVRHLGFSREELFEFNSMYTLATLTLIASADRRDLRPQVLRVPQLTERMAAEVSRLSRGSITFQKPLNKYRRYLRKIHHAGLIKPHPEVPDSYTLTKRGRRVRKLIRVLNWTKEDLTRAFSSVLTFLETKFQPKGNRPRTRVQTLAVNLLWELLNSNLPKTSPVFLKQDMFRILHVTRKGRKKYRRVDPPRLAGVPSDSGSARGSIPDSRTEKDSPVPASGKRVSAARPAPLASGGGTGRLAEGASPVDVLQDLEDILMSTLVKTLPFVEHLESGERDEILQNLLAETGTIFESMTYIILKNWRKNAKKLVDWSRITPRKKLQAFLRDQFLEELNAYFDQIIERGVHDKQAA